MFLCQSRVIQMHWEASQRQTHSAAGIRLTWTSEYDKMQMIYKVNPFQCSTEWHTAHQTEQTCIPQATAPSLNTTYGYTSAGMSHASCALCVGLEGVIVKVCSWCWSSGVHCCFVVVHDRIMSAFLGHVRPVSLSERGTPQRTCATAFVTAFVTAFEKLWTQSSNKSPLLHLPNSKCADQATINHARMRDQTRVSRGIYQQQQPV